MIDIYTVYYSFRGLLSPRDMLKIFFLSFMGVFVQSQTDPCADNQHRVIDDFRRDPDYKARASQRRLCDNLLVPGWYRFQINGTDADLPTKCVQVNGCGTLAPLWLSLSSEGLPLPGQQSSGNACATWKLPGRQKQCCGFRIKVQIRNCGEFFVYKLRNTGGCDLAYCAAVPNTFCSVGQIYVRHLEKCVDYKIGFSEPSIDVVTLNRQVYINCTFDIPNHVTASISPTFHVIWYKGLGATTFTIRSAFTTSSSDALILGEDVLPGETVTCSVESVQGQERKLSGPYFLGIKQINESLYIREDGGLYRLVFISTIPIVCDDNQDGCKLELLLQIKNSHKAKTPTFVFSSCLLEFIGGNTCEDGVCLEKIVTFKMIPNLFDIPNGIVNLRGNIYADDSISWNQRYLNTKIHYEDLASSICFILPGIQMLTFTGRVQTCRDTQLCICGIVIRYGDNFLKVDSCNTVTDDNQRHDKYISQLYKGRNGQMKVYEGRSGWLLYITLDKKARIRLDFGQTGIVVAVLLSGYFTEKVDGLCGKTYPKSQFEDPGNMDIPENVNITSTVWRIRPGFSYFDRHTVPPAYTFESEETENCDCSSATLEDPCAMPYGVRGPTTLVSLTEVTYRWINRTNNTYIPAYVFEGDYDTWPFVNDSEASLNRTEAEDQCLKVLLISSITRTCNVYLDQFFEPVLQICTELARYLQNSSWIPVTLRMLENLCEIGIISNGSNLGVNNTMNISAVDLEDIRNVIQCPENCHGNGICTADGCRCFSGFYGVECLKKAESDFKPVTTEEPYSELTTTQTPAADISFISCDIRSSSCSTVYIELMDTGGSFAVACVIIPLQFSDTGWRPLSAGTNSTLRYISNMLVECMLPEIDYANHKFPVFSVQVLDAGRQVQSSILYAVIDSACQQCDKDLGCSLQNDTCFIDGDCYDDFMKNPDDPCQLCQPDTDRWNWSNRSANRKPVFDTKVTAYSIMENDTLIAQFPASDPDGDIIQYDVNRTDSYINQNGNFKWKPIIHVHSINGSTDTFLITITDECGLTSSLTLTVVVFKCDCINNGSCPERVVMSNSSSEYKCICPSDFIGNRCETDINPCHSNPCYQGVACTSGYGVYRCSSCPAGYIGDGISCVPGCGTNPCFPSVPCIDIMRPIYGYRCGKCPRYFFGNGIECNRTDENPCRYDVCSPLVTCNESNLFPGYKCGPCPKGYLGNGTTCVAFCFPPCDAGNMCISPGQCACLPNTNCTDCRSDPCFPGVTCTNIKQYPGFRCGSCPDYFQGSGVNCIRTEKDACIYNVCSRLVTCKDTTIYPGYVCGQCPEGYSGNGTICIASCNPPCDENNICVSPDQCACAPNTNCTDCRSDPCFNGVMCTDIKQYPGYKCSSCPNFFQGNGESCIRTEESACIRDVCSRLVTCKDTRQYPGFICSPCPEGYSGNGTNCIADCSPPCDKDKVCVAPNRCECRAAYNKNCTKSTVDCSSNPCFPGVKCADLIHRNPAYKCGLCPRYFQGNGIECNRTDISACKSNVCSPLVTCNDTDTYPGYLCGQCPAGYRGNGKTCKALCDIPCTFPKRCVAPGVCDCRPGYGGVDCNTPLCCPKCQNHGVCYWSNRCRCRSGYYGFRCEKAMCNPPCDTGRLCTRPDVCSCPNGYTGPDCSISLCVPSCENGGRCVRPNVCSCTRNYCGLQCQYSKCRRQCKHGGICIGYNRCLCSLGYRGRYCQRSKCMPSCRHNGVCERPGVCRCRYGFYGQYCQKVLCNPPCYNGGVCRRQNICRCPPGYFGRYCQHAVCRIPCYNRGRCVAPDTCRCRSGWEGRQCLTARCPFGCQNGGLCARPGVCICKRGYWGNRCQYAACWPRCMYGGRCINPYLCLCRHRYTGPYCQIIIL